MKRMIIILLVFLLVACIPLKQRPNTDLHTGTQGLVMEFIENAPPDSVYEMNSIPMVLSVKNNGASDIINGYIAVGVDKYISLASPPLTSLNLGGRSVYSPEGNVQYINLRANAKKLDPKSQIHSAEIRATACYPYQTRATANVCIDTAVYQLQAKNKACEVKPIKLSSGQGAPVGITRVDTTMIPLEDGRLRPEFIIYLDNLGKGLIIDSGYVREACSAFSYGSSYYNIVRASVRLSDTILSCDREIQLLDNKDNFIRCIGEPLEPVRGTYPAPLSIELDYGYAHSISKIVKIINI